MRTKELQELCDTATWVGGLGGGYGWGRGGGRGEERELSYTAINEATATWVGGLRGGYRWGRMPTHY